MLAKHLIFATLPLLSLTAAVPIVETSLLGPLTNSAPLDSLAAQPPAQDPAATSEVQRRGAGDDARPPTQILKKIKNLGRKMTGQSRFPGTGRRVGILADNEARGKPAGQSSGGSARGQGEGEGEQRQS